MKLGSLWPFRPLNPSTRRTHRWSGESKSVTHPLTDVSSGCPFSCFDWCSPPLFTLFTMDIQTETDWDIELDPVVGYFVFLPPPATNWRGSHTTKTTKTKLCTSSTHCNLVPCESQVVTLPYHSLKLWMTSIDTFRCQMTDRAILCWVGN